MRFKSKKRLIGAFCMMSTLFLAFSGNSPVEKTGAPNDTGTCANCHANNGSFTGQINLSGIPSSANGMDVLTITAEVETLTGSPVRAGFSMVALDDTNDANAGDWLTGDGNFQVGPNTGAEYWGHQPALMFGGATTVSWEADWEAPNITDDVTFYICALIGNGSGTGGDKVECTSETISITSAVALSVIIGMESDATCEDSTDGSAEAIASDGTPPYDFEWDNGEMTAIATQLEPGTHTVTVTDDDGNTATASTFIDAQFSLSLDADITHIACHGIPNGVIDVITSGGLPPYDCEWNNLPDGCFHNNLAPGDYFVTVSDSNGCTQEEIFTVDDVEPLDLDLSPTNESTPGAMDGSIITNVDGGEAPYDYEWSTGATSANLTNISSGVYSVTVTDDNFCTISATLTITSDSTPCTLSVQENIMDVSCYGGTGGIGLFVMGASGALSYNWSDNSTGSNLVNAPAGTYSVTVTDAALCQVEVLGLQISQPDSLVLNLVSQVDASCPGEGDGGLIVSPSGGAGDYTLTWAFGMTNDTILDANMDTVWINIPDTLENLTPQIYPYSLTDVEGCVTNGFYQIANTDTIAPVIMLQQGQVILDANGNAPAADFSLVDGGSFDNCAITNIVFDTPSFSCSDIGINDYTVFVSDASGNSSSATASIQVYETTPPIINCGNSGISLNTCEAVNYTIPTATDNCDIPNVTLVSGLNSGSVFPDGTSTVVYRATDECGNSSTCAFDVTVTNTLMASVMTTDATCLDPTGSITVTASGGAAPYTFSPFSFQSGLVAGLYFVTVTDSGGCEVVELATIGQTDGPELEFSNIIGDMCQAVSIGSVTLSITQGLAPYTVTVNNDVPFSINTNSYILDALSGGTYSVSVVDANNCSVFDVIEIPSPTLPVADLPDFDVACYTDSVYVDFSDINPNYTFGDFPKTVKIGSYDVVVTDNNTGCTSLSQFSVTSPTEVVINEIFTNVMDECSFSTDEIITEISGGLPPYQIDFSFDGSSVQGPYEIKVSDRNGCFAKDTSVTFDLIDAEELTMTVSVDYSCDDNSRFVNVMPSGGCPPYLSFFDPPLQDLSNPPLGTYTVITRDELGNETTSQVFTVLENGAIVDSNVDVQMIGMNPGSVNLDISGGIGPYAFVWRDEAGELLSTEQNLPAIVTTPQTVTLTVTDSVGCEATFSYEIELEVATSELERYDSSVLIYPNPVDDKVHLEFIENTPTSAEIFATSGALLKKIKIDQQKIELNTFSLVPGLYFVKLDYGDKVIVKQFLKI